MKLEVLGEASTKLNCSVDFVGSACKAASAAIRPDLSFVASFNLTPPYTVPATAPIFKAVFSESDFKNF